MPRDPSRVAVLAVGGWDPTGGAGLSVDTAVLRALGAHPLAVCTGLAVQTGSTFVRRDDSGADSIRAQLDAAARYPLSAVKTGMLGSREQAGVVLDWLRAHPGIPWVLDPVLESTSGGVLTDDATQLREALDRATLVTPNLSEASQLTELPVGSAQTMEQAAGALHALGATWVWLKGGHLKASPGRDLLLGPEGARWLEPSDVLPFTARGTGCAAASAAAAALALGLPVTEAVRRAKEFVTAALRESYPVGDQRVLGLSSGA